MIQELIKYEAACRAVAEAYRVDEIKDIRDKHIAIQEYARVSKNFVMEKQALEIRMRAERKGGELLIQLKEEGKRHQKEENRKVVEKPKVAEIVAEIPKSPDATSQNPQPTPPISVIPKLADLGVDKYLSAQMQKLAKMPEEKFEEHIGIQKDKIDQKQVKEEAKVEIIKEREANRAEKERLKQERIEFNKRVDESDLDPFLKKELKSEASVKHIVPFTVDFARHLERDKEKLDQIMLNSDNLNIYSRHKLAQVLRTLGAHFIECAEKLKEKEHTPDFDNMRLAIPDNLN